MEWVSGKARLDDRGRLVLPSEVRQRLGLRPGDMVSLREEPDGTVRLESGRSAARALIGLAGSSNRSVVEELRTDRRRQAAAEERDAASRR